MFLSQHLSIGIKPRLATQALTAAVFGACAAGVYQWGTHAESNYEYAATRAVFAPLPGAAVAQAALIRPAIGNAGAPQLVDLTLPARLFQPLAAGQRPPRLAVFTAGPQLLDLSLAADLTAPPPGAGQGRVPPLTLGAPQTADLTIQGEVYAPNAYFAGASYPYRLAQGAPQLADLTLQGDVFSPTPLVAGAVPARVSGAPQPADLTQQADLSAPPPGSGQGRVPPLTAGAPQSADLTLQGAVWRLLSGPLPVVAGAEYQFGTHAAAVYESQSKGAVWRSVPTPPVLTSGPLGAFLRAAPQLLDLALQGDVFSPTPLVGGNIVIAFDIPAQDDPTQVQPQFFRPLGTPPAVAPFRLVAGAPQLADLTQQGWVRGTAPARQGAVPQPVAGAPQLADLTQQGALTVPAPRPPQRLTSFVAGAPQTFDLTQQGWVSSPPIAPPPVSSPLRTWAAGPQLVDLTQQGWVRGTVQALQGRVPAPTLGAPQLADLTLQGSVVAPLVTEAAAQPIVPVFAAPEQIDLTIQGWVRGAAPVFQGRVPALVFAAPQFVDLTLSVWWDASTEVRSVRIRPAPSGFSVTTRMSF